MYGMLVYIILSVFIAGLMVGRTPEYLGKKIQAFEVQMAMLTVLIFSLLILAFTAISSVSPELRHVEHLQSRARTGCRRCSTPTRRRAANNGSAFGGLSANTNWYNTTLGAGDAVRPVLHDHPAAGDRRQPGPQEARARRRSARSR